MPLADALGKINNSVFIQLNFNRKQLQSNARNSIFIGMICGNDFFNYTVIIGSFMQKKPHPLTRSRGKSIGNQLM